MFSSLKLKAEIADLKDQIKNLGASCDRLRSEKDIAVAKLNELKVREDSSKATPSIDFTKIRCFSVERNPNDGRRPITILGYNLLTDPDGTGPREWNLHCSAEHHESLVEQFNKQKKAK